MVRLSPRGLLISSVTIVARQLTGCPTARSSGDKAATLSSGLEKSPSVVSYAMDRPAVSSPPQVALAIAVHI